MAPPPCSEEEQKHQLKVLFRTNNTEMKLLHLVMLETFARTQTAATLRVRHVLKEPPPGAKEMRIPVGPGTGIDTKGNKLAVLHVPMWIYRRLHIYAKSERAENRRKYSKLPLSENYLFLTNRGTPYYASKFDRSTFDPSITRGQAPKGDPIRQFIRDYMLPPLRQYFGELYSYHAHDLRATGGMNMANAQMRLVEEKKITLQDAQNYVRTRMWHEDYSVTDRYLHFKNLKRYFLDIQHEYEEHLAALVESLEHE